MYLALTGAAPFYFRLRRQATRNMSHIHPRAQQPLGPWIATYSAASCG
jgi:hypothetical protein